MRFGQGARRVWTEHQPIRIRDGVERLAVELQILAVSLNELDVIQTRGSRALRRDVDHLTRQIRGNHGTTGLHCPRRGEGRIPSAARDVEYARACAPRCDVAEPSRQRREVALCPIEPSAPSCGDGVPVFPLSILDLRCFRGSPPIRDVIKS